MADFDKEKCAQRNRIAAKRDGVNAFPMKFLRGAVNPNSKTLASEGEIPETDAAALEMINAQLAKNGKPALKADDVYVQYMEAANDNFISDRFMFMSESTLKNIASNARDGFAFMNGHRTGGISTPSELPFGRTFAGRYEMSDGASGPTKRAILGVYMLKGLKPNGDSGPSTDALNASINGGTIFDVSVGLWGGTALCDVCGNDLFGNDREGNALCPHVPGSHVAMTEDQIIAQQGRGVKGGKASYTYDNAYCGEVSAVYDGAVPGAGFKKAMAFSRQMSESEWSEIQTSFAALFGGQENIIMEVSNEKPESFLAKLGKFLSEKFGAIEEAAPVPVVETSPTAAELAAKSEHDELQKQLTDERAARVTAEIETVMKDHGSKFGKTAREIFLTMLTDAKRGSVDVKTISARLVALAAALPPIGSDDKLEAGGKKIDAKVERIANTEPGVQDETRDVELHDKTLAKMKELKLTGPRAYETAYRKVLVEEEQTPNA